LPTATLTPMPTPTPARKLAEIAIVFRNPSTGTHEIEVIVIGLDGCYSPPHLVVLSSHPIPALGSPAITGDVIKLIVGDAANEVDANNNLDIIVLSDTNVATENNVLIFKNDTFAGHPTRLNYHCSAAFFASPDPEKSFRIVDAALVDADQNGDHELAIAFNRLDQQQTGGIILFYDLGPGATVIEEIDHLRIEMDSEIHDIQPTDLRRDNYCPDDLVVITEPYRSVPDGDVIHMYEADGASYEFFYAMDLGPDHLPTHVRTGEYIAFARHVQTDGHEDFVFGCSSGRIAFFANNWGRLDIPGIDQVPSPRETFDLPGWVRSLENGDVDAPAVYDDVVVCIEPEEPGADQVYQINTHYDLNIYMRQSGFWSSSITQAAPGFMNGDPVADLVFSDSNNDSINIVLSHLFSPTDWYPFITHTRRYPGPIQSFVITQHQDGRKFDPIWCDPPPTNTPTSTPTNTATPTPTNTPTSTPTTLTPTPTSSGTPLTSTPEPSPTGTYTPEPTVTAEPCDHCGDPTGDGSVTPGDAQLAFNLYLYCADYNPDIVQYCAADYCGAGPIDVCDNSVTPSDAQGIMRLYLGYQDPCSKQADCSVGVTGVVSKVFQSSEINLAVRLDNISCPLGAWGLLVNYDHRKIEYLSCSPGKLHADWAEFGAVATKPGVIVAGAYSLSEVPASSSGVLMNLTFRQKLAEDIPLTTLFKIDSCVDDLSGAVVQMSAEAEETAK